MPELPTGYEIGPARPDELARLADIEVEAGRLFPDEDIAPALRMEGLPLSFFEDAAAAGRLFVVRWLADPAPVGFAVVSLVDGSAHLYEIDVHPAHGRRGLGRALLLHVVEWARASGFPSLSLTTFRHLPWNGPFYASVGFVEVAPAAQGPGLREELAEEARNGLDPDKRVAMRLELSS